MFIITQVSKARENKRGPKFKIKISCQRKFLLTSWIYYLAIGHEITEYKKKSITTITIMLLFLTPLFNIKTCFGIKMQLIRLQNKVFKKVAFLERVINISKHLNYLQTTKLSSLRSFRPSIDTNNHRHRQGEQHSSLKLLYGKLMTDSVNNTQNESQVNIQYWRAWRKMLIYLFRYALLANVKVKKP